jgi:DNA polymerase I
MSATRRVLSLDSETCLIAPACMAPELVCITWQFEGDAHPSIAHVSTALPLLKEWFSDPNVLIVGHNFCFDAAVLCERFPELRKLIFAAYKADRITDTMVRAWLLDTAAGRYRGKLLPNGKRLARLYDLAFQAKDMAGIVLSKDDWRTSYAEFLEVPLDRWVERAKEVQARSAQKLAILLAERATLKNKQKIKDLDKIIGPLRAMVESDPSQCLKYPLEDARATLAVYRAQARHETWLKDQFRQARAYFALYLSSCWGIRTDASRLGVLKAEIEAEFEECEEILKEYGLIREDGTANKRAAMDRMIKICRDSASTPVFTEAHFAKLPDGSPKCTKGKDCTEHIGLDSETCQSTDDPILIDFAKRGTLRKQISNDLVAMAVGARTALHTRYGFAETGRTTSSSPKIVPGTNIQNISKRPGFREIYIPRPGRVFFDVDYPTLELYTWAQCCMSWLGFSKMAEALNGGMDPHLWFAAVIMGISYEDAVDRYEAGDEYVAKIRQQAKPANFGFPGGMGAETFLITQRKQLGRAGFEKLGLTLDIVKRMKSQWYEAWPEAKPYFARTNQLLGEKGRANPETLFTGRVRGNATYCATNNNGFQALGSDCAKNAAWLIAEAQYVVETSAMYNTRTVAFVHDQFLGECVNDHRAHDAAYECARLMCEGANVYLPDVPIPAKKMKPVLSMRWSKNARQVFGPDGRLVPWSDAA